MTEQFKTTPCSQPLHDWEDEQRAQDLVENLEQWAEQNLEDLAELGEHARVRRICTKWLDKVS
jgi:hypothetical protein